MRGTRSPGYLAASAIVGVAALTALAGCHSGPSAAASHAQKAVSKVKSAAGSLPVGQSHSGQLHAVGPEKPGVPGLPSTSSVPVIGKGMGTCNPSDLAKSFVVQAGDPGGLPTSDGMGMLVITNRSAQPCVLQGYAGLAMIGQGNQHIALQDVNLSTAGTPAKVDLASGDSAFQGADFASLAACPAVADAEVAPPGQNTPSVAPIHYATAGTQGTSGPLRVCPGVLNLGPLSASQAQALAAVAHHIVPVPANVPNVPNVP